MLALCFSVRLFAIILFFLIFIYFFLTFIYWNSWLCWASLVAQLVKNPLAMRETWVWSLGWEDPLEKGMYTHSSILAWRSPWTVWSMGVQRFGHDWATFTHLVALGLGCSIFSCDMRELLVVVCGIYFPDEGLNLGPYTGAWSLNRWTTRKVPSILYVTENHANESLIWIYMEVHIKKPHLLKEFWCRWFVLWISIC